MVRACRHPDFGAIVHQSRDGVWSIAGYSISNYTFIEGETGLIVFDTGNNIGMAQAVQAGEVTISGDRDALRDILSSFGAVSTALPDPGDMH